MNNIEELTAGAARRQRSAGNPAVFTSRLGSQDRKLCVPASRRVCPFSTGCMLRAGTPRVIGATRHQVATASCDLAHLCTASRSPSLVYYWLLRSVLY